MNRPYVPQPVLDAAHARSAARAARDWSLADRLREEIEAAGWRVVDRGADFRLEPAHAPDLESPDGVRYGRTAAVPSRLAEASTCPATVVLIATDPPNDLVRAVTGLRRFVPVDTQVVVVVDGPGDGQTSRLPSLVAGSEAPSAVEIYRTSARLGWGAALNIGLRRASGEAVVFMDTSIEPIGDVVTPLVAALRRPEISVAGAFGLQSADLQRFVETEEGGDAVAIEGSLLAFRRADGAASGPLDEAFRFYRHLDAWWSLALRDRGEGEVPGRAVVVAGLPMERHEHGSLASVAAPERERLSRRNFYRVLARYRDRLDLAVPPTGH